MKKGVNVFMEKSFAVDAPAVRRLLAGRRPSRRRRTLRSPPVSCGAVRGPPSGHRADSRRRDRRPAHPADLPRANGPSTAAAASPNDNELVFQLRRPACFLWLSGGFHVDWHCHNVDVACWAKGAWPVAAQGFGGRCYPEAATCSTIIRSNTRSPTRQAVRLLAAHGGCWQEYADYAHGSKARPSSWPASPRPIRAYTRARK